MPIISTHVSKMPGQYGSYLHGNISPPVINLTTGTTATATTAVTCETEVFPGDLVTPCDIYERGYWHDTDPDCFIDTVIPLGVVISVSRKFEYERVLVSFVVLWNAPFIEKYDKAYK